MRKDINQDHRTSHPQVDSIKHLHSKHADFEAIRQLYTPHNSAKRNKVVSRDQSDAGTPKISRTQEPVTLPPSREHPRNDEINEKPTAKSYHKKEYMEVGRDKKYKRNNNNRNLQNTGDSEESNSRRGHQAQDNTGNFLDDQRQKKHAVTKEGARHALEEKHYGQRSDYAPINPRNEQLDRGMLTNAEPNARKANADGTKQVKVRHHDRRRARQEGLEDGSEIQGLRRRPSQYIRKRAEAIETSRDPSLQGKQSVAMKPQTQQSRESSTISSLASGSTCYVKASDPDHTNNKIIFSQGIDKNRANFPKKAKQHRKSSLGIGLDLSPVVGNHQRRYSAMKDPDNLGKSPHPFKEKYKDRDKRILYCFIAAGFFPLFIISWIIGIVYSVATPLRAEPIISKLRNVLIGLLAFATALIGILILFLPAESSAPPKIYTAGAQPGHDVVDITIPSAQVADCGVDLGGCKVEYTSLNYFNGNERRGTTVFIGALSAEQWRRALVMQIAFQNKFDAISISPPGIGRSDVLSQCKNRTSARPPLVSSNFLTRVMTECLNITASETVIVSQSNAVSREFTYPFLKSEENYGFILFESYMGTEWITATNPIMENHYFYRPLVAHYRYVQNDAMLQEDPNGYVRPTIGPFGYTSDVNAPIDIEAQSDLRNSVNGRNYTAELSYFNYLRQSLNEFLIETNTLLDRKGPKFTESLQNSTAVFCDSAVEIFKNKTIHNLQTTASDFKC